MATQVDYARRACDATDAGDRRTAAAKPFGLSEIVDAGWAILALTPITLRTLDATWAFYTCDAPVLVRRGAPRPAITEVWS